MSNTLFEAIDYMMIIDISSALIPMPVLPAMYVKHLLEPQPRVLVD